MTRKVVLYIATSLDGYIARENGKLDWLYETKGEGDNGYGALLERIDTVVMGKGTYDEIVGFEGDYPYSTQKNYVFSKSVTGHDERAEFVNEDVVSFVQRLKNEPGKDIWLIGGGALATEFFNHDLIDEIQLAMISVVLGKGLSLYQNIQHDVRYNLTNVQKMNDFAMLHYHKQ